MVRTISREVKDAELSFEERSQSRRQVLSHGLAQGSRRAQGSAPSRGSTRGLSLEPQILHAGDISLTLVPQSSFTLILEGFFYSFATLFGRIF